MKCSAKLPPQQPRTNQHTLFSILCKIGSIERVHFEFPFRVRPLMLLDTRIEVLYGWMLNLVATREKVPPDVSTFIQRRPQFGPQDRRPNRWQLLD